MFKITQTASELYGASVASKHLYDMPSTERPFRELPSTIKMSALLRQATIHLDLQAGITDRQLSAIADEHHYIFSQEGAICVSRFVLVMDFTDVILFALRDSDAMSFTYENFYLAIGRQRIISIQIRVIAFRAGEYS